MDEASQVNQSHVGWTLGLEVLEKHLGAEEVKSLINYVFLVVVGLWSRTSDCGLERRETKAAESWRVLVLAVL